MKETLMHWIKNLDTFKMSIKLFNNKRFAAVNDEKLRQEYESKQKLDNANKQYNEIRSDLENLQQSFNDK